MNKKIEFNYDGKDYVLEYNRKAVEIMENNGLKIKEIEDKPLSTINILWAGAFLKNHKNEKADTIQKIYESIPNKMELNAALVEMFSETYLMEIGDSDNVDETKKVKWKLA